MGGGRSRAKVPKSENRTTDHAAPPGAEPPKGLRRRPAGAAVSGPPLTVVAGGADKSRGPSRERPQGAVTQFGGV